MGLKDLNIMDIDLLSLLNNQVKRRKEFALNQIYPNNEFGVIP